MSLINRYIFKQLIMPFIFGLIIVTFSLMTNRFLMLTDMVLNKGISIISVIKLASFTIPDFMVITLPVSFLLAVLITFGKMTQDNEIIALKASGIKVLTLTKPVLLFSLIPFFISLFFSFYMAPRFNYFFKILAVKEVKKAALSALKKNTFSNNFGNFKIFIRDIDLRKSTIKGIFILNKFKNKPEALIAKSGSIVYNKKRNLISFYLKDGEIQNRNSSAKNFWLLHFDTYGINIKLNGFAFPNKDKSIHFMTIHRLFAKYTSAKTSGKKNIYLIYIFKKIAVPAATILFVFTGIPLGMLSEKRSLFLAIFYTIIIVIIYYILFTSGLYLSIKSGFNPFLGVWGADIFLLIAGIFLYSKVFIK